MFNIIPWSEDIDLKNFYLIAAKCGYDNNSSQQKMIDCLKREKEWAGWILYQYDNPIGFVSAHSFDDVMGPNSYRICARTCLLPHDRKYKSFIAEKSNKKEDNNSSEVVMASKKRIIEHQNLISQYFIPACINWAGKNNNLYLTSNENSSGSQRTVNRIFFPPLEEVGIMKKVCEMFYRGTNQTVWQLNVEKFYEELNKYPIWN